MYSHGHGDSFTGVESVCHVNKIVCVCVCVYTHIYAYAYLYVCVYTVQQNSVGSLQGCRHTYAVCSLSKGMSMSMAVDIRMQYVPL